MSVSLIIFHSLTLILPSIVILPAASAVSFFNLLFIESNSASIFLPPIFKTPETVILPGTVIPSFCNSIAILVKVRIDSTTAK